MNKDDAGQEDRSLACKMLNPNQSIAPDVISFSQNQGKHQNGGKQQSKDLDIWVSWQKNGSGCEKEASEDADNAYENGWFCDPEA